jgi:hydrogenase maturation protease
MRAVGILCLGNALLADDAAGLLVAEALRPMALGSGIEVRAAEAGGMDLMTQLQGWDAAVVVDAMATGQGPGGTLRLRRLQDLQLSPRLRGVHDADLASALALGLALGLHLPRLVRVLGVEALDRLSFGLPPSPAVVAAAPRAARRALDLARVMRHARNGSKQQMLSNSETRGQDGH